MRSFREYRIEFCLNKRQVVCKVNVAYILFVIRSVEPQSVRSVTNPPTSGDLRRLFPEKIETITTRKENKMATPAANPEPAATAAVAVKLPDFWKSDPTMWFAQAEAQFALAGVTQDVTKFHHIVAKIDQSVICHVADLVKEPPADGKYNAIKTRLISRFELSPQSKLEKLLGACDLGDLRPTHLLAKMQELSSGLNVDDAFLKMLFLQRLPANIRTVLSINESSLANIAEMGDKMIDLVPHVAEVKVIPASAHAELYSQEDLAGQIAALTAEIRRLKSGPERSRSRSASRRRSENTTDICWYHRKYGGQAERCRSPCKYQQPKN